MKELKKIIIHAGRYHADDVAADAWLKFMGYDCPVVRTYQITEDMLSDPTVAVIDIGQRYQPELNNYDHHQCGDIPCASSLVLKHFPPTDSRLKDHLSKFLFDYIDKVDRGHILLPTHPEPTVCSVIRSMNEAGVSYQDAVQYMLTTIKTFVAAGLSAIQDQDTWHNDVNKFGYYATIEAKPPATWRDFAKKEDVMFLMHPNPRKERSYSITSRDTNIMTIDKAEGQTFLHANGFIASYETKADALKHIRELANRYGTKFN